VSDKQTTGAVRQRFQMGIKKDKDQATNLTKHGTLQDDKNGGSMPSGSYRTPRTPVAKSNAPKRK